MTTIQAPATEPDRIDLGNGYYVGPKDAQDWRTIRLEGQAPDLRVGFMDDAAVQMWAAAPKPSTTADVEEAIQAYGNACVNVFSLRYADASNYDEEEIAGAKQEVIAALAHLRVTIAGQAPRLEGAVSQAAIDVLAERRRQLEVEGWNVEHDDTHNDGQLALAAAAYAVSGAEDRVDWRYGKPESLAERIFPWGEYAWKPDTPYRDLVKSGALILAELERLNRLSTQDNHNG